MSSEAHEHRVIGGYKATIHNLNVSEEAKAHAEKILREHGITGDFEIAQHQESKSKHTALQQEIKESDAHERHVLGGYKAALHNPEVSDEAKAHAQEILEQKERKLTPLEPQSPEVHNHYHFQPSVSESGDFELSPRSLAGYKATVHNPKTSDEAKDHARTVLKEQGVDI